MKRIPLNPDDKIEATHVTTIPGWTIEEKPCLMCGKPFLPNISGAGSLSCKKCWASCKTKDGRP